MRLGFLSLARRFSCYDTHMRGCSFVAVIAILFGFGIADASPKTDIDKKIKEAMENYDLMDYDAARKSLNQALAINPQFDPLQAINARRALDGVNS